MYRRRVLQGDVQTLTRTLRSMLGLSEQPAAGQPIVSQLEAILPRAIQLGDGWRLVSASAGAAAAAGGAVAASRAAAAAAAAAAGAAVRQRRPVECASTRRCRGDSSEVLLRLFGKLNAWDVQLPRSPRSPRSPRCTKQVYSQGRRQSRTFRYHRTDPCRPMR